MLKELLISTLMFVSLINPIQKIFVMFTLQNSYSDKELMRITNRSSITALVVLLVFLAVGNQLLTMVFNIEIYSFQIICGVILCLNGIYALQKGAFFNVDKQSKVEDIIAVPLAIPMIAGPASITAAVTMPSLYGIFNSVMAILIGVSLNWVVMRKSKILGGFMLKHNIMNPMLRIFGLIVAAIGTQMVMNGIKTFVTNG